MWTLSEPFSEAEKAAMSSYAADSIFIHALSQDIPAFAQLASESSCCAARRWEEARTTAVSLISACAKSSLNEPLTVYSGHGNGTFIVGFLGGDAGRLVGLEYRYTGFISSSTERGVAIDNIKKQSQPVLMEISLQQGDSALHLNGHEFEVLLHNFPLEITAASWVSATGSQPAHLHLKMQASAASSSLDRWR